MDKTCDHQFNGLCKLRQSICPGYDDCPYTNDVITIPRERLRDIIATAWQCGYDDYMDGFVGEDRDFEYADRILAELEEERNG